MAGKIEDPGTPIQRYRKKLKSGAVGFLTEGDSWFAFPKWLRTNIIELLYEYNNPHAGWYRLQSNGDEARKMLAGKQREKLIKVLSDERNHFDGILFSGGGNDIVGRGILPLLNHWKDGMHWRECINMNNFDNRLSEIEGAYRELVDIRNTHHKKAVIFTHAYDYAIPANKPIRVLFFKIGPWIQKYMEKNRGIRDANTQAKIIHHMLTRLGDIILKLEQQYSKVTYVRTQGTLKAGDWKDEIHPSGPGFVKIAKKFQEALCQQFPNKLPDPSRQWPVSNPKQGLPKVKKS